MLQKQKGARGGWLLRSAHRLARGLHHRGSLRHLSGRELELHQRLGQRALHVVKVLVLQPESAHAAGAADEGWPTLLTRD